MVAMSIRTIWTRAALQEVRRLGDDGWRWGGGALIEECNMASSVRQFAGRGGGRRAPYRERDVHVWHLSGLEVTI